MRTSWEALGARARGLATHLLPDERVQALERVADAQELTTALADTPYRALLGAPAGSAEAYEQAVTRSLADRMALLARWAGADAGGLGPVYVEQDMRNIRDILRGVVGGIATDERTAGAIPTPSLGLERLRALARLTSPAEVAARLLSWNHPLGPALADAAAASRTDLFRLEAALARATAAIASRGARRGGRAMREFVREGIDARNAVTAFLLVGARAESDSAELFVEGGRTLSRDVLVHAASAGNRAAAAELLAEASRGTPIASALRSVPARPAALADRILNERIAAYTKSVRREPLTSAPVLLFVLRLRREARVVRRAAWAVGLGGGRRS